MDASDAVAAAWHDHWGRLLAVLARRYGNVDLAEEALADVFEAASRTWPVDGVPANPPAWLMTAAQRRALDRLRHHSVARNKFGVLVTDHIRGTQRSEDEVTSPALDDVGDDELTLLLLTCHPALAMAARLTRAKKKIAGAGLPFTIPPPLTLPARIDGVVKAIYLCFTAGYAPGEGDQVLRADLASEAIRLARVLKAVLARRGAVPPVVDALLALMLLQHSRRDARVSANGELVLLDDQDRSRWHRDEIAEALQLLAPLNASEGSAEQMRLQAAIAALHATSPRRRHAPTGQRLRPSTCGWSN